MIEQQGPSADSFHGREVMRNQQNGFAGVSQFFNAFKAPRLECYVTNRENLVQQQNIGVEVSGDGEAQSHEHARRILLHWRIERIANFSEFDNARQLGRDLPVAHSHDRAVEKYVFTPGEIRLKTGADLNQRCKSSNDLDLARARRRDARKQLDQRGFSRAVGTHDAQRLAPPYLEADITQGPGRFTMRQEIEQPPRAACP